MPHGIVRRTAALAAMGAGSAICLAGPVLATPPAPEAALQATACGAGGAEVTAALVRLKHLCPSPSDAVAKACMAALDERYRNKPVLCHAHANPARGFRQPVWWPQPRNDLLPWREVFEDPSTLRATVQAAVRNRACRLLENEFRPDLRRTCAADAMARLGVLHGACQ